MKEVIAWTSFSCACFWLLSVVYSVTTENKDLPVMVGVMITIFFLKDVGAFLLLRESK